MLVTDTTLWVKMGAQRAMTIERTQAVAGGVPPRPYRLAYTGTRNLAEKSMPGVSATTASSQ